MWKTGDSEDDKICIKIESEQFVCNRTTLSFHSPYFEAMFRGNFIEGNKKSITLEGITHKGFSNILNFIEENGTNIKFENVVDTIECASLLQFQDIHKIYFEHLLPEPNIDNCLQIWEDCELLDIHPLLEQAKLKAYKEFHQVIKTDYFEKLEPKQLHSYLSNTFIYCNNEMEIFKAGMKWWCGFSKNLKNIKTLPDEKITKYLLLVLSCIDFKSVNPNDIEIMLNHRKIRKNKTIISILNEIQNLLIVLQNKNNSADVTTYEELDCNIEVCEETKRLFSNSRRDKKLLNCIVTSERGETNKLNARIMNISYYDEKSKTLKKIFSNNSNFQRNCVYYLKGCRIIPFNENLLLIGGNCRRGKYVNDNFWIYYTDKDEWELYTWSNEKLIMPLYHSTLLSNDRLFITQKVWISRTSLDTFYFVNLKTHNFERRPCWRSPLNREYKLRYCIYKNEILFLSDDNFEAYLFSQEKCLDPYKKLLVRRRSNDEVRFPENIILFSIEDTIYIKDVYDIKLYEFEIQGNKLMEKNNTIVQTTMGIPDEDKFNYILDKNNLYLFTKSEYMLHGNHSHNHENLISDDVRYVYNLELNCLNLNSKVNTKLIKIRNEFDEWHMHRGCFQYSHYKAIEFNSCISKFVL